ncbi:hypothetical protein QTN25_000684 [Entamoeba marina]
MDLVFLMSFKPATFHVVNRNQTPPLPQKQPPPLPSKQPYLIHNQTYNEQKKKPPPVPNKTKPPLPHKEHIVESNEQPPTYNDNKKGILDEIDISEENKQKLYKTSASIGHSACDYTQKVYHSEAGQKAKDKAIDGAKQAYNSETGQKIKEKTKKKAKEEAIKAYQSEAGQKMKDHVIEKAKEEVKENTKKQTKHALESTFGIDEKRTDEYMDKVGKYLPDLTDEQKAAAKKKTIETSKAAAVTAKKVYKSDEFKAAKKKTVSGAKTAYNSQAGQKARSLGKGAALKGFDKIRGADSSKAQGDRKFDPSVTMSTAVKPKVVTDENGKKKIGFGVAVKPKLNNDGEEVSSGKTAVCMDATFDPKIKRNKDGKFKLDLGMKYHNPTLQQVNENDDSPQLNFDTKFKPKLETDATGSPSIKMKTETSNYSASVAGKRVKEKDFK